MITVNYTRTTTVGPISKQITVQSNAKNSTVVLSIKGRVVETTTTVPEKTSNQTLSPTN